MVERRIVGFVADEAGDWVAELDCLHRQHVRDRPPLWPRPWVHDEAGRAAHLATALDCPLCDRGEIPDGLVVVRTTSTWDAATMPAALRRDHRVAAGTWGRLVVHDGALRFVAATSPPTDVVVAAHDMRGIPPAVVHHVEPLGAVQFAVEFLAAPEA
jgi:tellurite resistance-related uncharacterized protein